MGRFVKQIMPPQRVFFIPTRKYWPARRRARRNLCGPRFIPPENAGRPKFMRPKIYAPPTYMSLASLIGTRLFFKVAPHGNFAKAVGQGANGTIILVGFRIQHPHRNINGNGVGPQLVVQIAAYVVGKMVAEAFMP